MLKIACAQLNYFVGDIEGNVARMLTAAEAAKRDGADIIAFSELSLTGYYPGDLLEEYTFMDRVEAGLMDLCQASAGERLTDLVIVLGAPLRRAPGPGKRLANSLVAIRNGKIVLTYDKQLLPTYNIFDERRHFEPGPDVARVLRVRGYQVGFMICEDGWNADGKDYAINPLARLGDAAPDLVISINASPSNIGKREQRHALFRAAAQKYDLPILYVNQVGGQDQLVFDGASFAVSPRRGVCFEAKRFEEDVTILGFEDECWYAADGSMPPVVPPAGLSPMAFYSQQIILGLRDYARRCGFRKAVVGCSGGIDSALTLDLAVEALGAENVMAITMPSTFSSGGSVDDSVVLCTNLGIPLLRHPIHKLVATFQSGYQGATGTPLEGVALENLQARIRGTILMEYSNANGHLLLTTGNKSEISVGYCTLYGDTNGGLGLIGDLYKTEVFALARYRNQEAGFARVPDAIIDKAPSAELAPGQQDTDSLPPYEVLDDILKFLLEARFLTAAEFKAVEARVQALVGQEIGRALIARIRSMIARNEYKRRQAPPILRVRGRAFGSGRQMPIAAMTN